MDYTNQKIYIWDYFSAPIALIWFLTSAWFFAIIISQYFLVPLNQPVVQPPFGGPCRETIRSKKRD
uniref:Uncharacterized protein n=1 Tax=Onchocerca volvulus TaxID=6282 RepID=A0A8R1U060_ONCVO